MRTLHLIKTANGASWAASLVTRLVRRGVECVVALPPGHGRTSPQWAASGATIAHVDFDRCVWSESERGKLRDVALHTDLVHYHFVKTTLIARAVLRKHLRVFQVPGPLHLENPITAAADLLSADDRDYWIASSEYTRRLYRQHDVQPERVFLSYYGISTQISTLRTGRLRARLGIPADAIVVGNISFMYPPKWYLGHRDGLKNHRYLVRVLSELVSKVPRAVGVLAGSVLTGRDSIRVLLRTGSAA